jgi:hypothetical protein
LRFSYSQERKSEEEEKIRGHTVVVFRKPLEWSKVIKLFKEDKRHNNSQEFSPIPSFPIPVEDSVKINT